MRVKILRFITFIAFIIFILSACCFESETWLPYISCSISLSWLLLIAIANTPKGDNNGTRKNL